MDTKLSQDDSDVAVAMRKLHEHCRTRGISSSFNDADPLPSLVVVMRNGRRERRCVITDAADARVLVALPLDEMTFLGGYSAICSYKDGWIEAAVRELGGVQLLSRYAKLFPMAEGRRSERLIVPGTRLTLILLTPNSGLLSAFERLGHSLILRVEGLQVSQHDEALQRLEEVSNSLFMQIDLRYGMALGLLRDRFRLRDPQRSSLSIGENPLVFPNYRYESKPSTLYWYARGATSMPLLQFLAYYQCIEFFFPIYSRKVTVDKLKLLLKDPAFDTKRDSDVIRLIGVIADGRRGAAMEERKQLAATLSHCLAVESIAEFLGCNERRRDFLRAGGVSNIKLLEDDPALITKVADRIYDLRCKVVHYKGADIESDADMILPFSKEEESLGYDLELIQFLAQRVLVASSVPSEFF